MSFFFNTKQRPRVQRGLFIPSNVKAVASPQRALMLRPTMALVVTCLVGVFLFNQAAGFTSARLSQPASPIVVVSETQPYQNRSVTVGANEAFTDHGYYQSVREELVAAHPRVVAINLADAQLEFYQSGQLTLAAPVQATASADSWRHLAAGYYTVSSKQPERYSSLEQAYYTNVIALNQRVALHGPAYKNDGSPATASTLGVALGASDVATLYEFVTPDTPVVVHAPANTASVATPLTPRGPNLAARSYLVRDLATEDTLAASQSATVVPVASLTKLMTALVVAEEYDLEGEVDVIAEYHATTMVPRLPGTNRTTVYDLLQLLLLESSNEAAEVLAANMGRAAFITTMNERATTLGLSNTTFTDPSGLDDTNQSSADDLYTLTKYLYEQHPYLLSITTAESAVAAARTSDFSGLENFNVIDDLDTFIGGKIGETEAARQTSVSVHEMDLNGEVRPVVIILLGSEARSADVTTLHRYVENQYGE